MIGPTNLLHPSPAPHFKTFQVFLICRPKRPSFILEFKFGALWRGFLRKQLELTSRRVSMAQRGAS